MHHSLEQRIALCYKVPRATSFIAQDVALFTRLNFLFQKIEKTNKDIYILETFNVIKTLSNIFNIDKLYIILCEFVNIEYHSTLGFIIKELKDADLKKINKMVKKFKEISDTED